MTIKVSFRVLRNVLVDERQGQEGPGAGGVDTAKLEAQVLYIAGCCLVAGVVTKEATAAWRACRKWRAYTWRQGARLHEFRDAGCALDKGPTSADDAVFYRRNQLRRIDQFVIVSGR